MSAKPLKYSEKVAVSFTPDQLEALRTIAEETGDSVSALLRRLAIQFMSEYGKK